MSGIYQTVYKYTAPAGQEVYLRDYAHAAKTFYPYARSYSPKFKFLFHVYFDINEDVYPVGLGTGTNFGLLVKTVKLPSYTFATHQLNQYNRKRIVQTKIKYDNVDISFHDDTGNRIRNMWYYYYLYYYNDSNKPFLPQAGNQISPQAANLDAQGTLALNNQSTPADFNSRNIYNADIQGDTNWGYKGESSGTTKTPFFKSITIYGFNQHNFVAYVLINPMITNFSHDTYSYAESAGIMENRMTIDYETVKYYQGALDGNNPGNTVTGFGSQENYDLESSPISNREANGLMMGSDGLVPANGGYIQDLANNQALTARQAADVSYNTYQNLNQSEGANVSVDSALQQAAATAENLTRNVSFTFPTYAASPGTIGAAGAPSAGISTPPTVG